MTAAQSQLPTLDTARLPRPWTIDGLVTRGDSRRWALFSPCGRYRYALCAAWEDRPLFDVIMTNPSKADERQGPDGDDPTFKRVRHFAVRNNCGGVLIRNLAALIETKPAALWRDMYPVGERNLFVLAVEVPGSTRVAAWGGLSKPQRLRVKDTLARAEGYCTWALRLAADGAPWHPLYLPNATDLVPFGRGAA